jgi:hypothetical protein
MRPKRFSIGTLGLLAVSSLAWSCSSKSEDCNANLNCAPYDGGSLGTSGAPGASGASGRGGASSVSGTGGAGSSASGEGGTELAAGTGGAALPPCDGSLSPDSDVCVIADELGVFVAPTGDDATADGTQAHPYATVTGALGKIAKIKHVYVCAADYVEPGTIEIPDRVSIYGGFTCKDGAWKYDAPLPAHLLPASPVGAMITDAKIGVVLQDLRIDAANAPEDGTGASSFGMMITGSQNVVLKRVEVRAGKGGKGKAGADGASIPEAIPSGDAQKGKAAECGTSNVQLEGGVAVGVQCTSQGGKGGSGIKGTQTSTIRDGGPGFPGAPNGITASQSANASGGDGKEGAAGMPGMLGTVAPPVGNFTASGYVAASGGDGTSGQPGQGGGGGASSFAPATCIGASGGAGGMGGCGGTPGLGGKGGGASIALLSWRSALTMDACKLVSAAGGAGGDGGSAQAGGVGKEGGSGGAGDVAHSIGKGGKGGDGGSGGNGGNGAGGSGGPSIALVYDGTAPTQLGPSILLFAPTPAPAGKGGTLGLAEYYGPDGIKGLTQDVYTKPSS